MRAMAWGRREWLSCTVRVSLLLIGALLFLDRNSGLRHMRVYRQYWAGRSEAFGLDRRDWERDDDGGIANAARGSHLAGDLTGDLTDGDREEEGEGEGVTGGLAGVGVAVEAQAGNGAASHGVRMNPVVKRGRGRGRALLGSAAINARDRVSSSLPSSDPSLLRLRSELGAFAVERDKEEEESKGMHRSSMVSRHKGQSQDRGPSELEMKGGQALMAAVTNGRPTHVGGRGAFKVSASSRHSQWKATDSVAAGKSSPADAFAASSAVRAENSSLPSPSSSSDGRVSHVECPVRAQGNATWQCAFVRAEAKCRTDSRFNYLAFFFCTCRGNALLGYGALALWLAALFFMLGNTAADYFCPSLEELSSILHLPPTVAGVTLLPLGNGAPDVFASIASFMGAQQGEVGLNSVLGAASFVVCVVGGAVCLVACHRRPEGSLRMDRVSFVRDVGFFAVAVLAMLVIIVVGKVNLPAAAAFLALYPAYGVVVFLCEMFAVRPSPTSKLPSPAAAAAAAPSGGAAVTTGLHSGGSPTTTMRSLPQWLWIRRLRPFRAQLAHPHHPPTAHKAALAGGQPFPLNSSASPLGVVGAAPADYYGGGEDGMIREPLLGGEMTLETMEEECEEEAEFEDGESLMWGLDDKEEEEEETAPWYTLSGFFEYFVKLPLTLPRMLTIPVHSQDAWSRTWFVASVTLALPFALLVTAGPAAGLHLWLGCACAGAFLGTFAFLTSTATQPPPYLVPFWVLAGFAMSILWFYAIANELVALLVAFGVLLQIDSAVLGLTVLAWGNSIGDLVANLALASGGKASRVQIAWSGCFAGPLFNTLVGLGSCMVLSASASLPQPFTMPEDPTLPWTLGFLLGVLLLLLLWLPRNGMKLGRMLGIVLVLSYCAFMGLRIMHLLGWTLPSM